MYLIGCRRFNVMKYRSILSYTSLMSVFLVVNLNLFGAWVLKKTAELDVISLTAVCLIGLVIFINIGRFLLWGWMHKRFDLSKSYPLTAIFFPLVALLSIVNGEIISVTQWIGILFITIGVVWLNIFVRDVSQNVKREL